MIDKVKQKLFEVWKDKPEKVIALSLIAVIIVIGVIVEILK